MNTVADDAPYPRAAYAWFAVICLQLAYTVALIDRQVMALLVQPIRQDLHISDTQFSLLVGAAFVIFYSGMGLVCGRLADTRNRRNLIVIGMVLWCCATVACGFANTYHQLFVARIMVGVGEAVLSPCAYSMIADYFPKHQRARAASAYSMAIAIGYGLALLFGGAAVAATNHAEAVTLPLIGETRSWQAAFMFVGLPGLIVAAIICFVKEPQRRELSKDKSSFGDALRFMRQRATILSLIVFAFALNGLITYSVSNWVPAMFIRNFGWTASQIGFSQGIILVTAGIAGNLVSGWWVSRRGTIPSNAVVLTTSRNALMIMPVCALIAGLAPTPALRLAGVAGLSFFGGFPSALAAVAIFHATPNQFRGQMTAVYLMTGTLVGLGIGATLIAAITDYVFRNDQAVGKSLVIVIAAAAIIGALLLHRAAQRPDKDFD